MNDKRDITRFDEKLKDMQDEFLGFMEPKKEMNPQKEAREIISWYVVIGALWILLSDRLLGLLLEESHRAVEFQSYKGWFFVIITGMVFYLIIYDKMKLFCRASDKVLQGYEELAAAHEELLAMDEELNCQFDEIEKQRKALMISDQRYELAVEGANDGIWDWDIASGTYFFSLKRKAGFGYSDEELPDHYESWRQLLHPEDEEIETQKIKEYLKSGTGIYESTYRLRCKNGEYRWILSRGKAIWNHEGQSVRVAGSHTDITEHMELQERLHQEKERYESIINGASVFILGMDTEGRIIEFNPFAEKLTGYKKRDIIGIKWSDLFIPEDKKLYTDKIIHKILAGEDMNNQENQVLIRDGHKADLLWNNNLFRDSKGNVLGIIALGTDITERKAMEKRLVSLAYYDSLTGLSNRQRFEEVLTDYIKQSAAEQSSFALLYLDLDNFKMVNDTLGHHNGDKLLKGISDALKATVDDERSLFRLSGDEFAIIVANVGDVMGLHKFILSIMNAINKHWVIAGTELYMSSSIGISIYPDHGLDASTLLKNADAAMYAAKNNSKNCYEFFTPEMNEKALAFLMMEKDLRSALVNNEFILHYQPVISLDTGKIVSVEALIRWLHPQKGMIFPNDFIPYAEEMGLIKDIGENVIMEACRQLKSWYQMGLTHISISVNLSALQLRQKDLTDKITHIMNQFGVEGKNLLFEITENIALVDLKQSIDMLNLLRDKEIKVALDDFGIGYSSLNYLKKLPIDMIKIDRAFVKDITIHPDEEFIAKTIIDLAHNMKLTVTAEGIETFDQCKILKKHGCDFGQGYLFRRPIPGKEIEELLLADERLLEDAEELADK